jgi:hypothetical protein
MTDLTRPTNGASSLFGSSSPGVVGGVGGDVGCMALEEHLLMAKMAKMDEMMDDGG